MLTRPRVQAWKEGMAGHGWVRARTVKYTVTASIRARQPKRGHPTAASPVLAGEFAYLMLMVKPWGPMFSCTPACVAYTLMITPLWFCIFRPATPPARVTPAPTAA